MEASKSPQNIVMLPPPSLIGHLIPFIELARKLVSQHNCTVTLIIPHDDSTMKTQKTLLQGIPSTINPIFLPVSTSDDLSAANQHPEMLASLRVSHSLPALRDMMSSLSTPAAALVVDLFAPYAIDIAKEFGIPAYIFFTAAAYQLSMFLDFTKIDESAITQGNGPPPAIMLPGSILLKQEDFSDLMKDNNTEIGKWFGDLTRKYLSADGIIVNSFWELEPEAFKNLELHSPPVYRAGPLIRQSESAGDQSSECLSWLNDQPANSVLFLSFGSGGRLSIDQLIELAFGLEISEQKFLWVVRSPKENTTKNPFALLPERFLERTKGRGMVVESWAPQVQVLSHGSVGGFVTHCGWSSILESIVFGVPLMAWPVQFEQRMNAVYLTDGLKGALRVKENENGIVERSQIAEMVKELMEGEEGKQLQKRMMDLKIAAANALSQEGCSTKALAQVVQNLINGK